MGSGFGDDDVPRTVVEMPTMVQGRPTHSNKEKLQETIRTRLMLWGLPNFATHELFLDGAPLEQAANFPELFLSFLHLDVDLMREILPLRGTFANYNNLVSAHAEAYKNIDSLARERVQTRALGTKVDQNSGRQLAIIENVTSVVSGVWMLSRFSNEVTHPKDLILPEGCRWLTLLENFSWLLAHTDHAHFSERRLDEKTGEETMEVKRGIFLPSVMVEVQKRTDSNSETLIYPSYLIRAKKKDEARNRFGWKLDPIFPTQFRQMEIPFVALCTPILNFK